jgi:hypothetical protein
MYSIRYVKFSFWVVVCSMLSDTVAGERRGARAVTIPPVTDKLNDSATQAAPSIEEGALFGNCRAEDCILGYGGSTVWNVIPVTRQTPTEQNPDKESTDTTEESDDKSVNSFGRFPSFVSRKDG